MAITPPASQSTSPQIYAAVDLGSNSFHMVVVSVAKGHVQIINRIKQKVRLASGLDENNMLNSESMHRGWNCLAMFAERLQDIPPKNISIVATATLRLAQNAQTFIDRAEQLLMHPIKVIPGEEEAKQIYRGVAYTSVSHGNTLVIDIGGASTEIIVGNGLEPIDMVSLNMGCVTYMERFFPDGKLTKAAFKNAIKAAKEMLKPHLKAFIAFNWEQCLGASGTPQALDEMLSVQNANDTIKLSHMYRFQEDCCACKHIDNLHLDGLQEQRRSIFPSGLAILIALFESLKIEQMQISSGALREGLIYNMLETRENSNERVQTVDQLIERFHIDLQQANRVTHLALQFLTQIPLNNPSGLDLRGVLQIASKLHEIGLHIEFKKHHLHGDYILKNQPLIGFNRQQQDCIRVLVRNHRQNIELASLNEIPQPVRTHISILIRIIRLASLLCVRRKDDVLPNIQLTWDADTLSVTFPENWLSQHPLISAELASEQQAQKQVGWRFLYK